MDQLNEDDVARILRLIEESSFEEMHLEIGDLKITVKKRIRSYVGESEQLIAVQEKSTITEKPAASARCQNGDTVSVSSVSKKQQIEHDTTVSREEEGWIPIKAPLLGTFYRSPRPGDPPFVEVGKFVTEDDTVCIIEMMKTMNHVKAGRRGRIAKICVENAQMVEYQQTLFLIEPEDASETGISEKRSRKVSSP